MPPIENGIQNQVLRWKSRKRLVIVRRAKIVANTAAAATESPVLRASAMVYGEVQVPVARGLYCNFREDWSSFNGVSLMLIFADADCRRR